MLIEFRAENHRSICDEQVLTMEADRLGDVNDPRPRTVEGHAEKLLPVGVLYGANASGKSNVLSALAFMCEAVVLSHRIWSPDEGVPRDPFAWGPKRSEPSTFEVTFLQDGVRYQYGFVVSDDSILEEWLFAWPKGHKQKWFERDEAGFDFGENLKGENLVIAETTRSNALFLSTAVQLKHLQLQPVYAWFRSVQLVNLSAGMRYSTHPRSSELAVARLFDRSESDQRLLPFRDEPGVTSLLDRFRGLLKSADIGVVDVRVAKNESDDDRRGSRIPRVQVKHSCQFEDAWLPLEEESRGTRTLFRVALPILQAIDEGAILIVDELEASLHPSLAQQIVQQFNDPVTNPQNAQLLFTTHDTNLIGTTLGEPTVRRDQVWLTEKNPEGATVLYPLTDFKPRKAENLERGYLQGRYGAIPFLGAFSITGK